MIVRAKDKKEARWVAGKHHGNKWEDKKVIVNRIAEEGINAVIITSYWEG